MNDESIVGWFTINGRHLPILKGESKEDAFKRYAKSKSDEAESDKEKQIEANKQEATRLNSEHVQSDSGERVPNNALGREATSKANEIIKEAKQSGGAIKDDLQEAVSKSSGKLEGLGYMYKSAESLSRKLYDNASTYGNSVDEVAKSINDAVRFTNVSSVNNYTSDFNTIMSIMKSKGYTCTRLVNTMHDTTSAYRGMNITFRSPKGQLFEVQMHTPKSIAVKEPNHKLYEEYRRLNPSSARAKELWSQMEKNSSIIETPPGCASIKNVGVDW